MRCLALFSGGLDSLLAIKLVEKQGIEVIPIMFRSCFFGLDEKTIKETFDFEVRVVDISREYLEVLYNPRYGYGKNMNPCIDCHAFMFKKAGQMMKDYGASFIITGEVVGQRPMSQNYATLRLIDKLSGYKGLIVRPLTAKNLELTIPEKKGWIDRESLLDIKTRSRKVQLRLLKEFNIKNYIKPGGGCLLTVPSFAKRVKVMKDDGIYDLNLLTAIKFGRLLRIKSGLYIIIGRNERENRKLKKIRSNFFIEPYTTAGPCISVFGDVDERVIDICKFLFLFYSKVKSAYVFVDGVLQKICLSKDYDFKRFMI